MYYYQDYHGKRYQLRDVNIDNKTVSLVGTTELWKAISSDGETYNDNAGRLLDEDIYCYVDEDVFYEDQDVLDNYVRANFV